MDIESTIAAVSSPPGASECGLLRFSGCDAVSVVSPHTACADLTTRGVTETRVAVGDFDLPATVLAMPGPHSYTGEDVVELLVPGNPLLLEYLVDGLVGSGTSRGLPVRRATAGEFTYRAWYNGRVSLDRAESVAAIIAAESDSELQAARHAFAGDTGRLLTPLTSELTQVLALVEAGIDFADQEDVVAITAGTLTSRVRAIGSSLRDFLASGGGAELERGVPRVVLRGPANAGKSTLFNALLGRERVVVHGQAGTTRDAIEEHVVMDGIDVLLVDTPGDEVQVAAAAASAESGSDLVLWCAPTGDAPAHAMPVRTKRDLTGDPGPESVCAFTAEDVARLAGRIAGAIRTSRQSVARSRLAMSHRQRGLASESRDLLEQVVALAGNDPSDRGLTRPAEVATLLRCALDALGAITGEVPPDDVLGLVFAEFCIGK